MEFVAFFSLILCFLNACFIIVRGISFLYMGHELWLPYGAVDRISSVMEKGEPSNLTLQLLSI